MSIISIEAPSAWLRNRIERLYQSTEKSKEYNDTNSFFACIYVDVHEDVLTMQSESMSSTAFVTVDDLEISGEGSFLVPAQEFYNIVKSIPNESDIKIEYQLEDSDKSPAGEIRVSTITGDSISFSMMDQVIEDEGSIPQAITEVPDKTPMVRLKMEDFKRAYKLSSSMAKTLDADQMAGQDFFSSCPTYLKEDGIYMFSHFCDSAFFRVDADESSNIAKKPQVMLTDISTTSTCINSFSDNFDIDVFIEGDKMMYLQDEDTLVSVNSINAGVVNEEVKIDIMTQAWNMIKDSIILDIDINAQTLFQALTRSKPHNDEKTIMGVIDNEVIIETLNGNRTVFKQVIPSSNVWLDDGERSIEVVLLPYVLKKAQGIKLSDGKIRLSVAFDNDKPWALLVYNKDDFSEENPVNYFLMTLMIDG